MKKVFNKWLILWQAEDDKLWMFDQVKRLELFIFMRSIKFFNIFSFSKVLSIIDINFIMDVEWDSYEEMQLVGVDND
jgi:hypothetical protein